MAIRDLARANALAQLLTTLAQPPDESRVRRTPRDLRYTQVGATCTSGAYVTADDVELVAGIRSETLVFDRVRPWRYECTDHHERIDRLHRRTDLRDCRRGIENTRGR